MLNWPSLSLPPINLWSFPNWRNIPEMGTFVPKMGTFSQEVVFIHGLSIILTKKEEK